MKIYNIYFSAKGTTEKCAELMAARLGTPAGSFNWLDAAAREKTIEVPDDGALLFSMPVYGGFIPKLCAEAAEKLKGRGVPAVIAAIYGNRHYDDALVQMKDLLKNRGFTIIAAGAFVAEHSIFPSTAAGRPDAADCEAMKVFAEKCAALLRTELWKGRELIVPGSPDYDPNSYKGVPFKPDGDESCVRCGRCANICPVRAIRAESPCETNAALCISCGACIRACPAGARGYHSEKYKEAEAAFAARCAERREAETYYAA